ncbi:MAG: hypothetical protein JKY48_04815 [Flavobacteriales bacterium]|nr:hypothetical protein [Flavobacteriales bacterium]
MKHLLLLTMFFSFSAFAENYTLSWTDPVEREDDSALARSEISHFTARDANTNAVIIDVIDAALNEIVHNFTKGSHDIVMTATDTDGLESVYSPTVSILSSYNSGYANPPKPLTFQMTKTPPP